MNGDKALVTEVSVTIKNDDSKLVEKSLFYNNVIISKDDLDINKLIKAAIDRFGLHQNMEAPEIIVKTKTVWQ